MHELLQSVLTGLVLGATYSIIGVGYVLIHRMTGMVFIVASIAVAAYYLPAHHLMIGSLVILAVLALLNSQFYLFLAGKRGISFMLAAIPFHLLYHFYSGVSFIIGFMNHTWATRESQPVGVAVVAAEPATQPLTKDLP